VVSRVFVIILALGVAAYRFATGAAFEAVGLLGLGAGLIFLKVGETRPHLRRYAWLCFAVTAGVIGTVLLRGR
jgi:hypothetical protein